MNIKKLLVSVALIVLISSMIVNCSLISKLSEDKSYLTPVPRQALDAFEIGHPVDTKLQAVIGSRHFIGTSRISWIESPVAVYAKSMTYNEACIVVEEAGLVLPCNGLAEDAQVWLVILKGVLTITPPKGIASSPHAGCAYAILESADGTGWGAGCIPCEGFNLAP